MHKPRSPDVGTRCENTFHLPRHHHISHQLGRLLRLKRRSLGNLIQGVSCIVPGRLFNLRRWLACGAVSEIVMAMHFLHPPACSNELSIASSHLLSQDEPEEKLSVTCQTSGARCTGGNKLAFSSATAFSVRSLYQT